MASEKPREPTMENTTESLRVSPMEKARSYQLEMFEESLKRNIIVAMDTGSGKTHIAIMRIQHELQTQKDPEKLLWFMAPNVALVEQQQEFITEYLPPGRVQCITGNHGVDTWSTQAIWNQALSCQVIVTTPQVLYDALCHGFVNISRISLLIFDEAHHCRSNHVYNGIMQEFYHKCKSSGGTVPAILGLSASPIINSQLDLGVIESNLDAIAQTPRTHRDELEANVNIPTLKEVEYDPDDDFVEPMSPPPPPPSLRPPLPSAAPSGKSKRNSSPLPTNIPKKNRTANWTDHVDPSFSASFLEGSSVPASMAGMNSRQKQPSVNDEYEVIVVEDSDLLDVLPQSSQTNHDSKPSLFKNSQQPLQQTIEDSTHETIIVDASGSLVPNMGAGAYATTVPQRRGCRVLNSLINAYVSMDITQDPYVIELKRQNHPNLHRIISSGRTDSQQHMKRFMNSACHLFEECGGWAVEWFVSEVIGKFLNREFGEFEEIVDEFEGEESGFWRSEAEEIYLRNCLEKVNLPEKLCDIETNISAKVKKLIEILLDEYSEESKHEEFSGLVFVNQRVAVAAVAQIIREHPKTKDIFKVGTMVGSSEGTGKRKKFIQEIVSSRRNNSLTEFRNGEKNLLVATAAIQEGVDVPDCHLVACFDLPKLLVEYIQRRGRARRKSSSYVLMYSSKDNNHTAKFRETEKAMVEHYKNPEREIVVEESLTEEAQDMEMGREMRIPSTGAMFNLRNVIPQLSHFCACLPKEGYEQPNPIYQTHESSSPVGEPRWSATVILPNSVDPALRRASSTREWITEKGAKQDAAFEAFKLLYEKKLVNDNLIPLHKYSNVQEDMILKRSSKMDGPNTLDPWDLVDGKWAEGRLFVMDMEILFASGETVGMQMILPIEVPEIQDLELFWTKDETVIAKFGLCRQVNTDLDFIEKAKDVSYRLFRNMYSRRMRNDEKRYEFAYLFAPRPGDDWDGKSETYIEALEAVGKDNTEIGVVRDKNGTPYIFRTFRHDIGILEAEDFKGPSPRNPETVKQDQPLLEVTKLSKRRDFLHPEAGKRGGKGDGKVLLLLPEFLFIDTLQWRYTQFALFVPFLIDRVGKAILAADLKQTLQFKGIPAHLIVQAVTASSARDPRDYQRLEFLGDSVLKVLTSIALVDEYPLWHEGYLSGGKDRVVSNSTLSAKSKEKGMSKWINTTPFTALKWTPRYRNSEESETRESDTKSLSTKVLADVVESLIGAAYVNSGFSAATEVLETFNLSNDQFKWHPIEFRANSLHSAAVEKENKYQRSYPSFLDDLEAIIGYSFNIRTLLLEAITHVSYDADSVGASYQRLEFLGDSILDMVVVQKLYHWPGKQLSQVQMHHLKSASVNAHFLAFLCLSAGTEVTRFEVDERTRRPVEKRTWFPLYRFLRHNHSELAGAQRKTARRYEDLKSAIRMKLDTADEYPWEDIHELDAPKHLSDMIESIIGAIWEDSKGSFEEVDKFVERIGIGAVLRRLLEKDVIVNHPLSRFGIYAAADGMMRSVKYVVERVKEGHWNCELRVDNELLLTTTGVNRAHAKTKAAKIGLKLLQEKDQRKRQEEGEHKMRDKEVFEIAGIADRISPEKEEEWGEEEKFGDTDQEELALRMNTADVESWVAHDEVDVDKADSMDEEQV